MKALRNSNFILLAITILALGLRIAAAGDEFWLDEAWSVVDVRGKAFLQIFTTYVDNNHLLNSIWLWLVGQPYHWIVYRIPAVLAGTGCVVLAWFVAGRYGRVAAILSAIVFAVSFPEIVYSSEARGYSLAVLFAFACSYILFAGGNQILYCVLIALGLLSHLTFAIFVLAATTYSCVHFLRRKQWLNLIAFVVVPMGLLALIYWGFARHLKIAGGPPMYLPNVLKETGDVFAGNWIFFAALIVFALATLIVRRMETIVFYLALIAATFLLLVTSSRPEVVYMRYFLLPGSSLLLLICEELCVLVAKRRWYLNVLVAAVTAALLIVNTIGSTKFIFTGRGSSLTALTYVATHSSGNSTTIGALWLGEGGDHESRIRRLVEFYQPYLPPNHKLILVKADDWPEWLLVTSRSHEMPLKLRERYQYQAQFPHYGPSGWTWVLYRRSDR